MIKKHQGAIVDNNIIKINPEKNSALKHYAHHLDNVIAFPKEQLQYEIRIQICGCYDDDDDLPNIVIEDID